jgi:hypothetical protein
MVFLDNVYRIRVVLRSVGVVVILRSAAGVSVLGTRAVIAETGPRRGRGVQMGHFRQP